MFHQKGKKLFFWILTFVFLGSISLLNISTTQTRYFDFEDHALLYRTNLYSLYKGNFSISSTSESNYRDIVLRFTFSQNNVVNDSSRDLYEIQIPKGCTIKSIASLGTSNGNQIVYQTPKTDLNTVTVQCNVLSVTNSSSEIRVPISIMEKVENESSFLYMEGNYLQSLANYRKLHPIPDVELKGNTIIIPIVANNPYAGFLEQIRIWGSENAPSISSNTLVNYVKTVFPNENSLFDLSKSLQGLSVVKKSTALHDEYHYTFLENFAGYAKTFETRVSLPRFMYFSTKVPSEIEKAFTYYLKNYTYPKDDYSVQLILDYVNRNGGISSLILPQSDGTLKKLLGFTYDEELGLLTLDSILVDIATPVIDSPIPIRFGTSLDMRKQFNVKLPKAYHTDIISSAATTEVLKNSKVYNSVMKNNDSVLTKINFQDQYLYYDKSNAHYILLNIYSLVETNSEDKNNYVSLTPLALTSEEVLFQSLAAGELEVQVTGLTKEEVMERIKKINELLETTVLDADIVWTTKEEEDGSELVVATYAISSSIIII